MFHRMWPRKYGWLNFAILECSLNVWIVNKNVFAEPELREKCAAKSEVFTSLPKLRHINLCWHKFQTSISSTILNIFGQKVTNIISGTYQTFWHIFQVYSTAFQSWVSPFKCWYLSSWGMPPLSCINFVDNEVTWGGDSKYNIQIWCKQL